MEKSKATNGTDFSSEKSSELVVGGQLWCCPAHGTEPAGSRDGPRMWQGCT